MKDTSIAKTVRAFCDIICILIIVVILLAFSLGITLFCVEITVLAEMEFDIEEYIEHITEYDVYYVVNTIQTGFIYDIPFDEVIDKALDNFGGIFKIITDFNDNYTATWDQVINNLLSDLIKLCIANYFVFLFTRLNYFIRFKNSVINDIAIGFTLPFYAISAFAVAAAIVKLIGIFILPELALICSLLFAILSFFLHLRGLSRVFYRFYRKAMPEIKVFIYLIKNLLLGVINSIATFIICALLDGLYNDSKAEALFIACMIFAFVLLAEDWILYRSPFKKR